MVGVAAGAVGGIDVATVDRYLGHLNRVLSRARAAGLVRPELEPRDLAVAVVMVLTTVRRRTGTGRDVGGDGAWRRYLALVLDGMRPSRDGASPLHEPPLERPELDAAMRAAWSRPRR